MNDAAAPGLDRPAAAGELVLTNARLVLPDEVIAGSLVLRAGRIAAIDPGRARLPAALDLEGDYLAPGLIDLHTDSLEKHYQPRSGVYMDGVGAAISHDVQIIGSGITTVLDSLTIGATAVWDARAETVLPMVAGLHAARRHGMLKADHLLHLRCEVTHPTLISELEPHLEDPLLRMLSLMDHAPGDRQSPDMAAYRRFNLRLFDHDPAALERHIETLLHGSRVYGPPNRQRVAQLAAARGIALASHDDASRAHVEEAHALGAVVSEFPTTSAAAARARELDLHVLMGSPNLVRGRSHSGNVSAAALAAAGSLDILSSDYIPSSLLPAAWQLLQPPFGWPLARALATVTAAPAAAAGLADRGRLAVGLRADLVQLREIERRPILRSAWSAGRRVA